MIERKFWNNNKSHKFYDWLKDLDWCKICCVSVVLAIVITPTYFGISFGVNVYNRQESINQSQRDYNDIHPYVQGKIIDMNIQMTGNNIERYFIRIENKSYAIYQSMYYEVYVGDCIALYDHNYNTTDIFGMPFNRDHSPSSYQVINCSICGC